MSRENAHLVAFNRGLVSRLALARVDLKRMALSASVFTNWMPRVLGSMMLRPGGQYLGTSDSSNPAIWVPFVFAVDDTALIELTADTMRVWVDDAVITRGTVTAAVTNGAFTSDITTGWTNDDDVGATSSWLSGYLALLGDDTNFAKIYQEITVNEANEEHALRVNVYRGSVQLRVGTAAGDGSYVSATLGQGAHSLAFTPTGNFFIQFQSSLPYTILVNSVAVEAAGAMEIPTSWGSGDLANVKYSHAQSGDIIFSACAGIQQQKIERRDTRSWSVVDYETGDGPLRLINAGPITITPSAISGDITLTASEDLFSSSHIGAVFKLGSLGQKVVEVVTAENQFSDPIRVTGVDSGRTFEIIRSCPLGWGTTVATLQRSIGEIGSWTDVTTYTADGTIPAYDDTLDNQIVYYRIGVKTGEFDTNPVTLTLNYSAGSIEGFVRIVSYSNAKVVSASVLKALGGTEATDIWWEGQWSTYRGWPTAAAFYEGRLFWVGKNSINGSVSDGFYSFDDDIIGDSGPINRSIGAGPVETINWLMPSRSLLVGGEAAVFSARSTSFEEPLTPTNFNLKEVISQGTLGIQAIKVDGSVIFAQAGGQRVYEISYDAVVYDYSATDLTAIVPEVCDAGIERVAVQRQPDTRIHFVLADGTVAILLLDKVEEVKCWLKYETDGEVEDVVVLPGTAEDQVYYFVKRTIDGNTVRYLEKWALESEAQGGTINKIADSFIIYSGAATTTITGLDHLEGETVCVWGNGKDLGTFTVVSGEITGVASVTYAIVGLVYVADWKSVKLSYAFQAGTSLTQKKRINALGLVMANVHAQGIKYGKDFTTMYDLPMTKGHTTIDVDEVYTDYDEESFMFAGDWNVDSRLCLRATAPRPVTVLAAIMTIGGHDKI